ncbi:MAG TPA: prepilin-type N-terminal cleavage/methylation domain-containing protein [Burkholderiaceae bacterium]|jgi:general secretion pathway protein G|nr:prepilin-type N-terminal cleavage/methylation domain-containing protein [Burkholderiaceae bacterium]
MSFNSRVAAFTLIELLLGMAILAVLATIAVPSYSTYIDRAKVTQAQADIVQTEVAIAQYLSDHASLPPDLTVLNSVNPTDPWGNPYQYLNLGLRGATGRARKDKSLVPINSDYDLYSVGKDGQSVPALTAKVSQDDVVRGRNGAFVGLGADF